jgi:hypothetical protein
MCSLPSRNGFGCSGIRGIGSSRSRSHRRGQKHREARTPSIAIVPFDIGRCMYPTTSRPICKHQMLMSGCWCCGIPGHSSIAVRPCNDIPLQETSYIPERRGANSWSRWSCGMQWTTTAMFERCHMLTREPCAMVVVQLGDRLSTITRYQRSVHLQPTRHSTDDVA